MQRSGCEDLPTVRQLLINNCGNLDAAVEDLIALSGGGPHETSNSTSVRSRSSHFTRKQLEKIRKQERKRASETRRKTASNNGSFVPDETVVIGKVQCLNI